MRLGGPILGVASEDPDAWAAVVKAQGYRAAGCPVPLDADAATVAAYRDAARENDILIAEVGAWSNPMAADADEAAAARATCIAALDLAERIGARCAVNITGSRGAKWDGPDPADLTPETFDLIVETTRAIADAVKPTRARYALETMPWMYPCSPDSYLALLTAIDRRDTAVHFDPVNLVNAPARYFQTGDLIRGFVSHLGDRIVSVHCKDIILRKRLTVHLDECRPGTGGLDYPALLRALHDLGDADLPLILEHLPHAHYPLAAAHIRAQALALGYDVADQPTAPAPAVNEGPFLRSADAVRRQGFDACHGGAGIVQGRHVIEGSDALAVPFVHDDVLPPGTSIGEHSHVDDEEIYYVVEGRGTILLDGARHAIGTGDVAVVRPGHSHGLINDDDRPLRLLVICSRP